MNKGAGIIYSVCCVGNKEADVLESIHLDPVEAFRTAESLNESYGFSADNLYGYRFEVIILPVQGAAA